MWRKFKLFLSNWTKSLKIKVIETSHFQERLLQRFSEEDLPRLEGALKKAFEKAKAGEKLRYTHPYYKVTVVVKKLGLNGLELITCWQKEEDAECI